MRAFILAGGKGTRSASPQLPKILTRVLERTLLQYQLGELLLVPEITKITILLGHGSDQVIQALNEFNENHSGEVLIDYIVEAEPLGSAGMLRKELLASEPYEKIVFVCFGDILPRGGILESFEIWRNQNSQIANLILVHPNDHPGDSDLVMLKDGNRILKIVRKNDKAPLGDRNLSPVGMYFLNISDVPSWPKISPIDLSTDVVSAMIKQGIVVQADTLLRRSQDIGTPHRYQHAVSIVSNYGLLSNVAVFIDRDDTLIRDPSLNGYHPIEIELMPGAIDFLRNMNVLGIPIICISNQPAIAKGLITVEDVEQQILALQFELNKNGVYVDAFSYCPHHPEIGHKGEVLALKKDCRCRKPKPGLVENFAKKHGYDLRKCIIVGDSPRDIAIDCSMGLRVHFNPDGDCTIQTEHSCFGSFKQITDEILFYIAKFDSNDNY